MEAKISSDSKIECFRRSLDQLNVSANDLEDHFSSTHHAIQEHLEELHAIRDSVQEKLEVIEKRKKELHVLRESTEERLREVEAREKEFELIQEKEIREMKSEFELIEKSRKELEAVSESIERKSRLLGEKEVSQAWKEIEIKEKKCAELCYELKLKEEQIKELSKIMALKDDQFREFEAIEKQLEEKRKELALKAEKFEDLELKEKLIEERCEELKLEKKKFMERCEEVELKQKQKQLNLADANLHFTVTMDGEALQIFLNEHCEEHDSMRNEVLTALGFSSDPAKLVLDAIQGFYPPHLKKGDKEFEKEVIRRSCILLLEHLLKLSVDISPLVKIEALRIAFDWLTKMKTDPEHSLEVLGFLQLLASYRLASAFDYGELLNHLEIVAQHSQAPELLRVLGFADKVSGFVQNLLRRKQQVEAIRFIYAFELVNEFPPVPLLNDFLSDSKNAAINLRKTNTSLQGQIEAANKRIADLRCAIRCIEECKFEYTPSLKILKQRVESLGEKNLKRKAEAFLGHKIQKSHHNKKKRLASTSVLVDFPVHAPVTASATSHSLTPTFDQPQQLSGNKRPRIAELAENSLNRCCGGSYQGDLPLKSKDLDLQPKPNCFSVDTNKEDLRPLLNINENHQMLRRVSWKVRDSSSRCIQNTPNMSIPPPIIPENQEFLEEEGFENANMEKKGENQEEELEFDLATQIPDLSCIEDQPAAVVLGLNRDRAYHGLKYGTPIPVVFKVANHIMNILDRPVNKGSGSLKGPREWFDKLPNRVKRRLQVTGFVPLIEMLPKSKLRTSRVALTSLIDRWMDSTHTFHLPVGELTITPLDICAITGLRFSGEPVPFDCKLYIPQTRMAQIVEFLGFTPDVRPGRSIPNSSVYDFWKDRSEDLTQVETEQYARCFLLYTLSCVLFPPGSCSIYLQLLPALADLDKVASFNWGGAVLSQLYTGLDECCRGGRVRGGNKELKGFWIILLIWAYELKLMTPPQLTPSRVEFPRLGRWMCCWNGMNHQTDFCRSLIRGMTWDMLEPYPWGPESGWLQVMRDVKTKNEYRILLEGPTTRTWYLGDRIRGWQNGPTNRPIPGPPPLEMFWASDLPEEYNVENCLAGFSMEATKVTSSYLTFITRELLPFDLVAPPTTPSSTVGSSLQKKISRQGQATSSGAPPSVSSPPLTLKMSNGMILGSVCQVSQ